MEESRLELLVQHDARVPPGLTCATCKYELTGLDTSDVCPECGLWVRDTIETLRAVPSPWPAWLRLLRSGYFASFTTLLLAASISPLAGRYLGMTLAWYRTQFIEILALCAFVTILLGFALFIFLAMRGHWLAWWVLCTGPILIYLLLGALGQP